MNAIDPRYYQITALGLLLAYGIFVLDFGVRWYNAAIIIVTAQAVQWLAGRAVRLPRFDPLSALITALSLTILLRTEFALLAMLAATIAIASKFLIRLGNKHVFNPANLALVIVVLATDRAWISSGQWGGAAVGAFALACLGFVVLTRARRAETTIAFLAMYALLVVARALWLGDPMSIPLHQMQNGALLLFAFFMISDPRTAPNTRIGRVAYGMMVAAGAYVIRFAFYEPSAPILALVMLAPVVPLIDVMSRGLDYQWNKPEGDLRCDTSLRQRLLS